MKTKIASLLFICLFLISAFASAQIDSLKAIKIKSQNVEIGKHYEVIYPFSPSLKGKLIAVNKLSFIMMINNELEEINASDISRLKEIDADNIVYTARKLRTHDPIYSLSAGYMQRKLDKTDSYNYYYTGIKPKMGSFDIQGDVLIKTSDNFGFRIDVNYIHIYGKKEPNTNISYNSYDTSSTRTEIEYKPVNIFTAKTGVAFGSMRKDLSFNIYMFLGLGFGWLIKDNDVSYTYKTKNNVTTLTTYPENTSTGFMVGIHGQIRLSYNIKKSFALFIEPTYQYWGNKTDQLYGINGGITFLP